MSSKGKILRFLTVGVSNTAIDFGVTNLLFWMIGIYSPLFLLLYGVVGFCAANLNSYLLNKHWTFNHSSEWMELEEGKRFLMVSLIGFVIHSSIMMSSLYLMEEYFNFTYFFMMNGAKILAVLISFSFNFLGYRFFTFENRETPVNEDKFVFSASNTRSLFSLVLVLTLFSTALRLLYLQLTTYISGDAVNYAWVAEQIALSRPEEINPFWYNLFCLWESLFYFLDFSRVHATILSSLIPGILIPIPIFYAAYKMFGEKCAFIAGMMTAFHPRFIEYACNGYAESFYLLAFFTGITCLLYSIRNDSLSYAFWFGICFGVYFCVRPEALAPFTLGLLALIISTKSARGALLSCGGLILVVAAYSLTSYAVIHEVPLMQKGSNLFKTYAEQLDPSLAAKETYSKTKVNEPKDLLTVFKTLALRYPSNLKYLLTRLPTVLLSPLFIFALLYPMLRRRVTEIGSGHLVLLIPFIFPIGFYPLIQLEPRLLLPILMPIHIYGSAGLLVISWILAKKAPNINWATCLTTLLILLFLPITLFRGIDLEKRYSTHRNVAQWIESNVPKEELLVGSGYGMINTTGFLTSHPYETHFWAPNPKSLIAEEQKRGTKWLIVYEYFLKKYNPELLPILSENSPHLEKRFVSEKDHNNKVIIFKIKS